MKRIATFLSIVSVSVIVGSECPAGAQPTASAPDSSPASPAKEDARTRFRRGVELFREGNFAAALIEFRRAYETAPNFNVLYNIGQVCTELGDYASAHRALQKYLDDGGVDIAPARRAEVERDIERLNGRIGYLRIKVSSSNADIAIDDVVIGRSPMDEEVLVNSGRRKVTVNGGGMSGLARMVDVAVGEHAVVALEETPAAPSLAPPQEKPRPVADASPKGTSSSSTPLWIGLVTTGVLAAGTVVSGVVALSAKSSLDDRIASYPTTTRDVEDARDRGKTWAIVADVFGGATLVAAGVTTYLAITRGPAPRTQSAALGVGPGSVMLSGRF